MFFESPIDCYLHIYCHCKQVPASVNRIFYDVLFRILAMKQLTDHKVKLR